MEEILLYFALKYEGDFKKILKALQEKESVTEMQRMEATKSIKCKYTTVISSDYPECFKEIDCPPFVLFYYGDLSLLNKSTISVVGNRDISEYGGKVTEEFVRDLVKEGYTIVSGMALGVDGKAHHTTLLNKGKTIAVLASGIDHPYPKRHSYLYEVMKVDHLVISEHPGNYVPKPQDFLNRNRIIAGAGDCLLVTESKIRSGTMATVGYALDCGKNVYCVPGRINDHPGCNKLIQQGANLVLNVHDILEDERSFS